MIMMTIPDIYVKSKSVCSWSYRRDVTQLKISVRKRKNFFYFWFFMRVTPIHIFFLDWSTIFNNSEKKDIFTERRTRPRSTSQPLVTKTTSTSSLRTKMANTRNKQLSEGKIYFDGNLTSNMTLLYCVVLDGHLTSKLPSPPCPL